MQTFEASGVEETPAFKRFERQFVAVLGVLFLFFCWVALYGSAPLVGIFGAALVGCGLLLKFQQMSKSRRRDRK
jgi:Flp pilus assembly protein TadB